MGRLITGILLMAIAFVLLFLFISLDNQSPLIGPASALFCQPGERYQQEVDTRMSVGPSGRLLGFPLYTYCVNTNGDRREINPESALVLAGAGFGIPFALGLILMLWGVISLAACASRRARPSATVDVTPTTSVNYRTAGGPTMRQSTMITVNGQDLSHADLPPEKRQAVQQMIASLGGMMDQMTTASAQVAAGDLVSKLKQLDDARDKGMITAEEYDRLRQATLNNLADGN